MKRALLIVLCLAAGSAFAKDECASMCEEDAKECTSTCEEGIKKVNAKAAKYCAPKCKEMQKQCEKDCNDEKAGRKVDDPL